MNDNQRPAFLLANAYGPGSEVSDLERIELWTKFMRLAATRVWPDQRPCSYGPWLAAFNELGASLKDRQNFCLTYETISRTDWHDIGAEWLEFALSFLECDVMLFRSGYAKRRFIHRLSRCKLPANQLERCEHLLRRAVTDGTGKEEFIEYCAMAARLDPAGLADWLVARLGDTVIALTERGIDQHEQASGKLHVYLDNSHLFGLTAPHPGVIELATRSDDPLAKVRRNAWRMLWAILRRRAQRGNLSIDALPFPFSA